MRLVKHILPVLYPDGTLALNGKKSELRYDAFEELANRGAFYRADRRTP